MIWYNIRKLERKLSASQINEKQSFIYLLALTIFLAVIIFFPESPTSYSDFEWYFAEFLIFLIIMILTVSRTYKINKSGADRELITRFISLGLVHSFRLLIWVMIIGILYKIIMFIIPLDIFLFINELLLPDWTDIIIFTSIFVSYYIFMVRSFKRVNKD